MTNAVTVEGMSCGHCEQTIEEAVRDVNGVIDVRVDREIGRVRIDGDTDEAELVRSIEDVGYTAYV